MLKSIAFYILGLALLGVVLFGGLNLAERGIVELAATQKEKGLALNLEVENGELAITFAGKIYRFSWPF